MVQHSSGPRPRGRTLQLAEPMPYRNLKAVVAAIIGLSLAVTVASCAPSQPPPSVIVVVIDTLRADHLGLYGYDERPTSPALDRRSASAAVFERAFTTAPWTLPSFGSMLTGQIPTRHSAGVRVERLSETSIDDPDQLTRHQETWFLELDESVPTLAGVLREAGYATAAVVNNAFLSPEFGINRGFESYDYAPERPQRTATEATDLALEWLADQSSTAGSPFFLMVHYFDPHEPYAAPEPFHGRFAKSHLGEDDEWPFTEVENNRVPIRRRDEGWERMLALETALYDEEIAYVDQELERFLQALDDRGFWDNGYLLLTSDHGEEFNDHGLSEHGHTLFNELIRVPFLVWGPGVSAGRFDLPVSVVDIMPTLLDAVGLGPVEELAGSSILDALREGPAARAESAVRFDRALIAERTLYGQEQMAIIRWPWKALAHVEHDVQFLFDLDTDFAELAGERSGRLEEGESKDRLLRLLAELQTTISEAGAHAPATGATLSEETLNSLRTLGYIR